MNNFPIIVGFSNPYNTPVKNLLKHFSDAVIEYQKKPYHIQRLIKVLGKKVHIKFQTSQRVALMNLLKFACDPKGAQFETLRQKLDLQHKKIDGILSMINTIAVLFCCCNLETFQIGTKKEGSFKHFSQPYLAAIADCHSKTIYRHLKHLCTVGVMKQIHRNQELSLGLYNFHSSCKIIFERLFEMFGVKLEQLMRDHAFCVQQSQINDDEEQPTPSPEPEIVPESDPEKVPAINPTDEYEFAAPLIVSLDDLFQKEKKALDARKHYLGDIEYLKELNILSEKYRR